MNINNLIFVYFGVGTLLLLLATYYFKSRNNKHRRNIRTGKKILNKLASFDNNGAKLSYLRKIDPFVFEELILSAFKNNGFKIKRNKRYTGDKGIDGRVKKDGKLYLIQAKRYSSVINPSHVTDFSIAIQREKACGGFFVHTGRTGAKSYQNRSGSVEFISGSKLLELIDISPK